MAPRKIAATGPAKPAAGVTATAADSTTVENRVGGLGVGLGGTGVGAVADVVLINNGASASVGSGTRIDADRDITVDAESTRTVDSCPVPSGRARHAPCQAEPPSLTRTLPGSRSSSS